MTQTDVEHIHVPADADGQRLDRWLKKRMPFVLAQKLIRTGQIRVDGKRVKPDTRISEGQDVRIPPFENAPKKKQKKPLTSAEKEMIRSWVLYDDGDIVVLNKPADIASQGGENVDQHVDRLLPALAGKKDLAPKLIHRLDKETSGLMVVARVPDTIRKLGKMFQQRDVKKIYWALVSPTPADRDGVIRAPIGQGSAWDKMTVDEDDGKYALTEFKVIDKAADHYAFVAFWPRTGRTHQIRVHAAEILESPIVGDKRYHGDNAAEGVEMARRLHLHARRLVLPLPGKKNKVIDVTAPLPDDLKKSWTSFNFDPDMQDDPFSDGGR